MTPALIIILALAVLYFFVGAYRSQVKWEREKSDHRKHGGTAPKK